MLEYVKWHRSTLTSVMMKPAQLQHVTIDAMFTDNAYLYKKPLK